MLQLGKHPFAALGITGRPLPRPVAAMAEAAVRDLIQADIIGCNVKAVPTNEAAATNASPALPPQQQQQQQQQQQGAPGVCWTTVASPFWIRREMLFRMAVHPAANPLSIVVNGERYINATHTDSPHRFSSTLAFTDMNIVLTITSRNFVEADHNMLAAVRRRHYFSSPYWVAPQFATRLLGKELPKHATVLELSNGLKVVNAADTHDAFAIHEAADALEQQLTFLPSFGRVADIMDALQLRKLGCTSDVWVAVRHLHDLRLSLLDDAPSVEINLAQRSKQTAERGRSSPADVAPDGPDDEGAGQAHADPSGGATDPNAVPTNVFVNGDYIAEKDRLHAIASHAPVGATRRPYYFPATRAALSIAAANFSYKSSTWLPVSTIEKFGVRTKPCMDDPEYEQKHVVAVDWETFINADNLDISSATEEEIRRSGNTDRRYYKEKQWDKWRTKKVSEAQRASLAHLHDL